MANEIKETIGLIGVGRMGLPMLKHLVRHEFSVTACDISPENAAKAREAGASMVAAPAAVGRVT